MGTTRTSSEPVGTLRPNWNRLGVVYALKREFNFAATKLTLTTISLGRHGMLVGHPRRPTSRRASCTSATAGTQTIELFSGL